MSKDLWTWGGTYFGRRERDELWSHHGTHVGRFVGNEVYGPDGRYLGEIKNGKLITQISSKSRRKSPFSRKASRVGHVPCVDHAGTVMYVGYEDFPNPEAL